MNLKPPDLFTTIDLSHLVPEPPARDSIVFLPAGTSIEDIAKAVTGAERAIAIVVVLCWATERNAAMLQATEEWQRITTALPPSSYLFIGNIWAGSWELAQQAFIEKLEPPQWYAPAAFQRGVLPEAKP